MGASSSRTLCVGSGFPEDQFVPLFQPRDSEERNEGYDRPIKTTSYGVPGEERTGFSSRDRAGIIGMPGTGCISNPASNAMGKRNRQRRWLTSPSRVTSDIPSQAYLSCRNAGHLGHPIHVQSACPFMGRFGTYFFSA